MKNDVKLIRYCPWNLNCSHFYAYGRVNEGFRWKAPAGRGVDRLFVGLGNSVS